jgi:hypothetical protein
MRFELLRAKPLDKAESLEEGELALRSDRHYTELMPASSQELRQLIRDKNMRCITDPISDSVQESIEHARREYAKRLIKYGGIEVPADVRLEEITASFAQLGLETSPVAFIETDIRARQKLLTSKHGGDAAKFFLGGKVLGRYKSHVDVAAVNVSIDNWLPGTTAHELAHSSAKHYIEYAWAENGSLYYASVRSGLSYEDKGEFFEEGRAELFGTEVTNMVYENNQEDWDWEEAHYIEAAKYQMRYSYNKRTAIALELIIALKPEIFPNILRGDGSDESMAEIAAACDEIEPGLFNHLNKLTSRGASYIDSLIANLIDAQFAGDRRATLYASKFCSELIQEGLAEED